MSAADEYSRVPNPTPVLSESELSDEQRYLARYVAGNAIAQNLSRRDAAIAIMVILEDDNWQELPRVLLELAQLHTRQGLPMWEVASGLSSRPMSPGDSQQMRRWITVALQIAADAYTRADAPASTSEIAAVRVASAPAPATAPRLRRGLPPNGTLILFRQMKYKFRKRSSLVKLYKAVGEKYGVAWQVVAALDWRQTHCDITLSAVAGDPVGQPTAAARDGASAGLRVFTKQTSLEFAVLDLKSRAREVYGVHVGISRNTVESLAKAFAAYNMAYMLQASGFSPMEFTYSTNGLDLKHQVMYWPKESQVSGIPDDLAGRKDENPIGAVTMYLLLGGIAR